MSFEKSIVVYLDQKCWINIAKLYYHKSTQKDDNIARRLLEASRKEQMIFPLSLSHLDETNRISNDKRRNQLAFLMAEMSRGYSFQPYFNRLVKAEIRNIVLRKLGLTLINIRGHVLQQGISNLLGAQATLEWKENDVRSGFSEDVKKRLLDMIESPKTIEFALK